MIPPSAGREFTYVMRFFCPAGETAPPYPGFTETGCYRIVSSNPGLIKLNHSVVLTCMQVHCCILSREPPYLLMFHGSPVPVQLQIAVFAGCSLCKKPGMLQYGPFPGICSQSL